MTSVVAQLERPVAFRTAAKKVARAKGHKGHAGGYIKDASGRTLAHGWDSYGQLMARRGLICQDTEHDGANGKWYVWAIGLTADELRRVEAAS